MLHFRSFLFLTMEGLGDLRTKRSRKHTKNEKIDLNILQKKEKKVMNQVRSD